MNWIFSILLHTCVAALLFCAAYQDAKQREVANWVTLVLIGAAVLRMLNEGTMQYLFGIFPALLLFLLFLRRGKQIIGGADVKVLAGIGLYFGFVPTIAILFSGSVLALVTVLIQHITKRPDTRGIPLCTWMAVGTAFTALLTIL